MPTNALELVDVAAARAALEAGEIEARRPVERPLDLLAQHAVTIAIGGGFRSEELLAEVRTTWAYRDLRDDEWRWVLDFITRGGNALQTYPEYSKVVERDGRFVITSRMAAMRHRLSIGTIVSESAMKVQLLRGRTIGTVEENFIARLRPGDVFTFAGRTLEFVRVRGMVAHVRRSTAKSNSVPHWSGARMPISPQLATWIRVKLDEARRGIYDGPEMEAVRRILELQAQWSRLPATDELLIERVRSREGHHLFFYPVEGRLVHEGLAALFAYRIAQLGPISFTLAANDYGLELLSPEPAPLDEAIEAGLLSAEHLLHDIPASLNAAELARRQFREIARIAGLVFQGYPGASKAVKQVQASSELLYDVFARYDPDNLLLIQAHREVLERQLEQSRLARALQRVGRGQARDRGGRAADAARLPAAGGPGAGAGDLGEAGRPDPPYGRPARACRGQDPLRARRARRLSERRVSEIVLTLAGEEVRLLPERALFWPRTCTLVVADVHWGKAATFRAAGIPIPGGTTGEDLARLDAALSRTGARRLVVLGDLFHARAGRIATRTLAALRGWRERCDRLEILLVRGNHDRHAGDPPDDLRINCVNAPAFSRRSCCGTSPVTRPRDTPCGPPASRPRADGPALQRERLPCFLVRPGLTVLPAFGSFTGLGHGVARSRGPGLRGRGDEVGRRCIRACE